MTRSGLRRMSTCLPRVEATLGFGTKTASRYDCRTYCFESCTSKLNSRMTNGKWFFLGGLLVGALVLASCSSGNSSGGLGVYPKALGAADEASAIQSLRTIATAQQELRATRAAYGNFDALTQAGLLDARFAGSTPNLKGYRFTMNVTDSDFSVNADPHATATQPTTGVRHFYLDSADNSVHVNVSQAASKNDPAL
jgi:hypothetical protein